MWAVRLDRLEEFASFNCNCNVVADDDDDDVDDDDDINQGFK